MKKILFILISAVFVFSSCASIMMKTYGLKNDYTIVNQNNIESLAKKYKVPLSDWYELDTLYYRFIMSYDKKDIDSECAPDHLQLLQALYFDESGDLISFHTSGWAMGFPNFNWNRKGILNTFVPETQTQIDTLVTVNKLFPFLKKTPYTEEFIQSDYDYIVAVFWWDVMGRQSKRLIKFIQRNVGLAQNNERVKIIYVNIDNFEYELAKSREE